MKAYLLWVYNVRFGGKSLLGVYSSESKAREKQEELLIHTGGCKRYWVEEREMI